MTASVVVVYDVINLVVRQVHRVADGVSIPLQPDERTVVTPGTISAADRAAFLRLLGIKMLRSDG